MSMKFFIKHDDLEAMLKKYDALGETKKGLVISIDFHTNGGSPHTVTATVRGAAGDVGDNGEYPEHVLIEKGGCPYPPPC